MSNRRALVVAPLYENQFEPLAGRPNVVKRLDDILRKYGHYDVKLLDGVVERSTFRASIREFFNADGELLFYFYGHGTLREPETGIFVTSDTKPDDEGLEMREVIDWALSSNNREVILIIDCCCAGAAVESIRTVLQTKASMIHDKGRCLLAACAQYQEGWEVETLYGSMSEFTYHIISALEGRACQSDRNEISANELWEYVRRNFESWKQDPIGKIETSKSRPCIVAHSFLSTRPQNLEQPTSLNSDIIVSDKEMLLIPAGPFLMGKDKKQREHRQAFFIDKFPVTNAEYSLFAQTMDYSPPSHWTNKSIPRGIEDHPVVGVTWHDAQVYAKWIGKELPTHAQWEKAARGIDGRRYPWGNEFDPSKTNTKESSKGMTTPVYSYQKGKSPFDIWDMSGNVWEWIRNEEGFRRASIRGGAWNVVAALATCFYTINKRPGFSHVDLGFRCVKEHY